MDCVAPFPCSLLMGECWMPIFADCSPKGLESRDFSFDHQITLVPFDSLTRDDSEEEQPMQPVLEKRRGYVSQSAVALRCQVMPPPCVKNPYLNTDPCIDDAVYGGRQCNSAGIIVAFCAISNSKSMYISLLCICESLVHLICNYNMPFQPQCNKNYQYLCLYNERTDRAN